MLLTVNPCAFTRLIKMNPVTDILVQRVKPRRTAVVFDEKKIMVSSVMSVTLVRTALNKHQTALVECGSREAPGTRDSLGRHHSGQIQALEVRGWDNN